MPESKEYTLHRPGVGYEAIGNTAIQAEGCAPVAILGAGIAGLTAASFCRAHNIPFVVFEAGKQISGLAASFQEDGFTYDFGAHFITNRLAAQVGILDQCRVVPYYGESVVLKDRVYTYPLGLVLNPRFVISVLAQRLRSMRQLLHKRLSKPPAEALSSAAAQFTERYGSALAAEIAIPLTEAWSGALATDLAPSVADKLPVSAARTLFLKMAGRLCKRAFAIGYSRERPEGLNVWHVYPESGVSLICRKLAEGLRDSIRLESPVEKIFVEAGRVDAIRVLGVKHKVSAVISTAPCSVLPRLIEGSHKLDHLAEFRFRPMVFVMLRFKGRNLLPDVVTWTPEKFLPFFRLTETPLSMPWLAPAGKTLITADFGCEQGDEIWRMSEEDLERLCLNSITRLIPDARDRFLGCRVLRTPFAYPVFMKQYEAERIVFRNETGIDGLYSVGRNGEFDHLLTEDVYWRTLNKMESIASYVAEQAAD